MMAAMTTCRELYERSATGRTISGREVFAHLKGCYFDHMPELSSAAWHSGHTFDDPERVTVRIVQHTDYDGRRYWQVATVWLDEQPFMVIQNAGREGDDHFRRFVTDAARYHEAVRYLIALSPATVAECDVVDADEQRDDLTAFYGDRLDVAGIG